MNKYYLFLAFALGFAICLLTTFIIQKYCINHTRDNKTSEIKNISNDYKLVYEKGMLATGNLGKIFSNGDVWVKMLQFGKGYNSYDVIFSPGARTIWHSHSQPQLLYVLSGEGWYQEEGKDPIFLKTGDSVEVPINTKHWHGASYNSSFEHLGLTLNPENEKMESFEKVSDEDYSNLKITGSKVTDTSKIGIYNTSSLRNTNRS